MSFPSHKCQLYFYLLDLHILELSLSRGAIEYRGNKPCASYMFILKIASQLFAKVDPFYFISNPLEKRKKIVPKYHNYFLLFSLGNPLEQCSICIRENIRMVGLTPRGGLHVIARVSFCRGAVLPSSLSFPFPRLTSFSFSPPHPQHINISQRTRARAHTRTH